MTEISSLVVAPFYKLVVREFTCQIRRLEEPYRSFFKEFCSCCGRADGILTLTDVNGKESVGEGEDPIKLHYAYSASDQLTGDYTIPASTFEFAK